MHPEDSSREGKHRREEGGRRGIEEGRGGA